MRKLLAIASWPCLLLAIACVYLTYRSCYIPTEAQLSFQGRAYGIDAYQWRLRFFYHELRYDQHYPDDPESIPGTIARHARPWLLHVGMNYETPYYQDARTFLGFGYSPPWSVRPEGGIAPPYQIYHYELFCPILFALVLLTIPPVATLIRRIRRRTSASACPTCGYDLRGHFATLPVTVRCPECGTSSQLHPARPQPRRQFLRASLRFATNTLSVASLSLLLPLTLLAIMSIWNVQTATLSRTNAYTFTLGFGKISLDTDLDRGEREWPPVPSTGSSPPYWAAASVQTQADWQWSDDNVNFQFEQKPSLLDSDRPIYHIRAPIWLCVLLLAIAPAWTILRQIRSRNSRRAPVPPAPFIAQSSSATKPTS